LDGIHVHKGVDYSKQLKVHQLVHQTSGLSDYFDGGLAETTFKKNQDRFYSVEDVLDMARNASPFAAPDSGKSHYSDTNYQLLGAIIEAITGQSLADAFRTRIFDRLEMADTYLFDHNMRAAALLQRRHATLSAVSNDI
jgi:CubicO group peptidase (beta-lactamase class C family)